MNTSSISSPYTIQDYYPANTNRLNFAAIAALNAKEILAPIEADTGRTIVIKNLTSILGAHMNESHPEFQQLVGDFFIFQMPIFEEYNAESGKYANEGYAHQGSRMAFHRPKSITTDFKQALRDPKNNTFLLVSDAKTGEILGSISLLQCDNGLPEISNFYLSKKVRRTATSPKIGLGKYLFSQMLSLAAKMGHKEVFLTSRRKGGFEQALNLFSQFGFKEVTKAEEVNRLVRPEYQSSRTIAMLLTNI